jgi:hypothetical protein
LLRRHAERGLFIARTIYWEVYCREEARPLNVSLFTFHALLKLKEQLITFEKLILTNEYNFRFINVEVARTIISAMESSMEMSLFQWSQVFKNLEWKPMIDAWFGKFRISIYLNNFCSIMLIQLIY